MAYAWLIAMPPIEAWRRLRNGPISYIRQPKRKVNLRGRIVGKRTPAKAVCQLNGNAHDTHDRFYNELLSLQRCTVDQYIPHPADHHPNSKIPARFDTQRIDM